MAYWHVKDTGRWKRHIEALNEARQRLVNKYGDDAETMEIDEYILEIRWLHNEAKQIKAANEFESPYYSGD